MVAESEHRRALRGLRRRPVDGLALVGALLSALVVVAEPVSAQFQEGDLLVAQEGHVLQIRLSAGLAFEFANLADAGLGEGLTALDVAFTHDGSVWVLVTDGSGQSLVRLDPSGNSGELVLGPGTLMDRVRAIAAEEERIFVVRSPDVGSEGGSAPVLIEVEAGDPPTTTALTLYSDLVASGLTTNPIEDYYDADAFDGGVFVAQYQPPGTANGTHGLWRMDTTTGAAFSFPTEEDPPGSGQYSPGGLYPVGVGSASGGLVSALVATFDGDDDRGFTEIFEVEPVPGDPTIYVPFLGDWIVNAWDLERDLDANVAWITDRNPGNPAILALNTQFGHPVYPYDGLIQFFSLSSTGSDVGRTALVPINLPEPALAFGFAAGCAVLAILRARARPGRSR